MASTILRNCNLHITSEDFATAESIVVQNKRIIPLDPVLLEDGSNEEIDLNGMHVAPGLIDMLVYGCAGVTFNQSLSSECLELMRRYLSKKGITTFVPTLISGPRESMTRALTSIANFRNRHPGVCPGVHLEGPFISPEKKGFHPSGYIRGMSDADITYLKDYKDSIAYMTVAPETLRNKNIQELLNAGIVLSVGHSNATFAEALNAFRAGIKSVTHLFNGMKHVTGRDPGILGAAALSDSPYVGIIADGRHVHPALIKVAHKLFGDRLYIVSDMQAVVGSPDNLTSFTLAGTEVFVDRTRGLIDSKGALAGSNVTLMDSVKFLVKSCGFSIDEALRAATEVPAKILGIDKELGRIQPGYIANLIVFDDEFRIRYVVQNGFLKTAAELL